LADEAGEVSAMLARMLALLIGTLALASLRGQFDVLTLPTTGEKLWQLAAYFTILTNLGVAAAMLAVARGWRMGGRFAAGLVLSMTVVALVYHLVLARLWHPEGMAWWADQGLHSAVPLAVCLWWLAFADKRIGWRDLPLWLIWPALYGAYAMGRGAVTGVWAYPFLDAGALGYPAVSLNIGLLLAVFAGLGAGLIGVARLVR
jgi:hypothetical protein